MAWDINDDEVTMTDSSRSNTYVLHQSTYTDPITHITSKQGYSCVESYKLYGGPQQPFEYVVLNISKKRLSSLAPLLVNDIRAGLNILTIYGFGLSGAQYVVTNCKSNSDVWKITAYSVSEDIRGYTTTCDIALGGSESTAISIAGSPAEVMRAIIEKESTAFTPFAESIGSVHTIVMAYRSSNNHFHGVMKFSAGTSMWYILSICAMRLGCTMWVSNDILYAIDFSLTNTDDYASYVTPSAEGQTANRWIFDEYGTVFLNKEGVYPFHTTDAQNSIMNNVVGTPDPGQEGRNLIKNKVVIKINTANDEVNSTVFDDDIGVLSPGTIITGMHAYYNDRAGQWQVNNVLDDPNRPLGECKDSQERYGVIQQDIELKEATRDFAQKIADLLAVMYCDSEQPISFTMRETSIAGGANTITWYPLFDKTTRINRIVDYSNDLVVSTASNLNPNIFTRPAKGMISRWVRNFPEHTTTYTFGEIAPTDMTQNNSIIHTAIGSGGM